MARGPHLPELPEQDNYGYSRSVEITGVRQGRGSFIYTELIMFVNSPNEVDIFGIAFGQKGAHVVFALFA